MVTEYKLTARKRGKCTSCGKWILRSMTLRSEDIELITRQMKIWNKQGVYCEAQEFALWSEQQKLAYEQGVTVKIGTECGGTILIKKTFIDNICEK